MATPKKMMKKRMSMAQFERSPMDEKMDKRLAKKGVKEGSKKDRAADKKALTSINKKRSRA